MGQNQFGHTECSGLFPDEACVGVILGDVAALRWQGRKVRESHCLVDQNIGTLGEYCYLIAHAGISGNDHRAGRGVYAVSHSIWAGFVTNLSCGHYDIAMTPDLGWLIGNLERYGLWVWTAGPTSMIGTNLNIACPSIEERLDVVRRVASRCDHRKFRVRIRAIHDPMGEDNICQPNEMIAVMVCHEHRGEIRDPYPGSRKSLHGGATRIELQRKVAVTHQCARARPVRIWNRRP